MLLTLWNIYSFFTGYAAIDKFHPSQKPAYWKPENELDRWVLSELNELVAEVDRCMEGYDPTNAGRRIQEFVDRLSNWYVRRSRRRFWRPLIANGRRRRQAVGLRHAAHLLGHGRQADGPAGSLRVGGNLSESRLLS